MKVTTAFACCLFLSVSAAAAGDSGDEEMTPQEYQQMLQQAAGSYTQAQAHTWDARLKVVSGSVMVKSVDSEAWTPVTGEVPLEGEDSVKTGSDGVAELYLDDKGAVSIGRNSELEMSSLAKDDAVLSLKFGSLVAKIKHFLSDKLKMQVRTPAAVCAIRGTEFAVEYSLLGKDTSVAVFDEGRVAVTQTGDSSGAAQEYVLDKNNEISFNPSQKRFHAIALSLMARHRGELGLMRTRLAALKGWRPLSPAKRMELRNLALKRRIVRRQIRRSRAAKASSGAAAGAGTGASGAAARAAKRAAARKALAKRRAERRQQAAQQEPQDEEPQAEHATDARP